MTRRANKKAPTPRRPQIPQTDGDVAFPQVYPQKIALNSQGCTPGSPQAPRGEVGSMPKNTDVIRTEVADRMSAIGSLGKYVAAQRLAPEEALRSAEELLRRARHHLEPPEPLSP